MNPEAPFPDWSDLLKKESTRVDWKAIGDPLKIAKTLCAFANDYEGVGGGYVICGLRETKDEHGFQKADPIGLSASEIQTVKNKVFQHCQGDIKPPIGPHVEEVPLKQGERRLLVFFQARSRLVHQFKEEYPIRLGDRVIKANGHVSRLFEIKGRLPAFLEQAHQSAGVADIDLVVLENDLQAMSLPGLPSDYLKPDRRFPFNIPPLVQHIHQTLRPVNLALLLFSRSPSDFIPGARVIFSQYDGFDRTATDVETTEFKGPLSVLVSDALRHLRGHMTILTDKDKPAGRQNHPRFSERAVSEAVINALVHRDYAVPHPVRITLFKDRLEVSSPGGLLWDVDEAAFKRGQAGPKWRNDTLAIYMIHKGVAQYQGQGIPTILKETQRISSKHAEFLIEPENVTVLIPAYQGTRPSSVSPETGSRPGLILISFGAPPIHEQVKASLPGLKLAEAEIALNFSYPHFLQVNSPEWHAQLDHLKREVIDIMDQPAYSDFHLFIRGPIVVGTLVGALFGGTRRVSVYTYEEGRYVFGLKIDKKYLKT